MKSRKFVENIFKKASFCRHFENKVYECVSKKKISIPVYLSAGQEYISATLSEIIKKNLKIKPLIFPQHRCHSYYLTFGGVPYRLALELCGSVRGCNKGMGGSASVSNTDTANLIGHSGLLGDQIPIAVGCAHASNKPTVVALGDAAAEEDYALGSLGFAATKKAPILFICEDNDLSILTKKEINPL